MVTIIIVLVFLILIASANLVSLFILLRFNKKEKISIYSYIIGLLISLFICLQIYYYYMRTEYPDETYFIFPKFTILPPLAIGLFINFLPNKICKIIANGFLINVFISTFISVLASMYFEEIESYFRIHANFNL